MAKKSEEVKEVKNTRSIEIVRDVSPRLVAGAPEAKAGVVVEVDSYMAGVLVASGYGVRAVVEQLEE